MDLKDFMKNSGMNGDMGKISGDLEKVSGSLEKDVAGGAEEMLRKVVNAVKQTEYIEDVTVISGKKGVSAPVGYEKLDVDLNMKAGGSYVYLCVKRGGDEAKAITDLTVVEGKGASAPAGFEKINVDLNEKAGGKYLYLCKKRGGGKALRDIQIVWGDNSKVSAPPGYTRIDRDLNEKAGGKYIYLCYR